MGLEWISGKLKGVGVVLATQQSEIRIVMRKTGSKFVLSIIKAAPGNVVT
jgi:hypothetical protein